MKLKYRRQIETAKSPIGPRDRLALPRSVRGKITLSNNQSFSSLPALASPKSIDAPEKHDFVDTLM